MCCSTETEALSSCRSPINSISVSHCVKSDTRVLFSVFVYEIVDFQPRHPGKMLKPPVSPLTKYYFPTKGRGWNIAAVGRDLNWDTLSHKEPRHQKWSMLSVLTGRKGSPVHSLQPVTVFVSDCGGANDSF